MPPQVIYRQWSSGTSTSEVSLTVSQEHLLPGDVLILQEVTNITNAGYGIPTGLGIDWERIPEAIVKDDDGVPLVYGLFSWFGVYAGSPSMTIVVDGGRADRTPNRRYLYLYILRNVSSNVTAGFAAKPDAVVSSPNIKAAYGQIVIAGGYSITPEDSLYNLSPEVGWLPQPKHTLSISSIGNRVGAHAFRVAQEQEQFALQHSVTSRRVDGTNAAAIAVAIIVGEPRKIQAPWSVFDGNSEIALPIVGRWNGQEEVLAYSLEPHIIQPPPPLPSTGLLENNRYVSASDLQVIDAAIDAKQPLSQTPKAVEVYTKYGMATPVGIQATPPASLPWTFSSTATVIGSPNWDRTVKLIFNELSKYPPDFIKGAGFNKINLPTDIIQNADPDWDVGGVANYKTMWVDINGSPAIVPGSYWDDGQEGVLYIFHHEMHHALTLGGLYYNSTLAMQSAWTALNPHPYIGAPAIDLDRTVRPSGHLRYYGRHSFKEDIADVSGFMFATSQQPILQQIMSEDPVVSQKVQMLKNWYAQNSSEMSDPEYWLRIHAN